MAFRTIDVHAHPVFPGYREELVRNNAVREDGFVVPDNYTVEHHIEMMDELEVQWALGFVSSPHPYFGDDEACIRVCREYNEAIAKARNDHPNRFGFCAILPHPCLDAAIEEAIYALDALRATGIRLASNSRGLYMGDPTMDPLFEELNKRSAILTMHPVVPAPINTNVWSATPIPLFEFICDTTRAVINMIGNGIFDRYPNLRLIVPHSGSFLPNIQLRLPRIAKKLANEGVVNPINYENAISKLYYDIAGDPVPHVLEFLLTMADPTHILYGSDYPFNPDDTFRNKIGILRNHLEESEQLRPYKDMFMYENACKLFGLEF